VLKEGGYDNVSVKVGDGYYGWPDSGPFDAMIVTAALEHVPPPLIEQLKIVTPSQTRLRSIILVSFVPFTRSKD
jgi:protein-L-isoaspartate(D-aspartate) O-methyltransferase